MVILGIAWCGRALGQSPRFYGMQRSLVAHCVWDARVAGSNPVIPTVVINDTSLVQLVERRSPKPDVVGSSPTGRAHFYSIVEQTESIVSIRISIETFKLTLLGSMPEWLMGADCKSAGYPTLVRIQLGPKKIASLAQGPEHRICNATVIGSNPIGGF